MYPAHAILVLLASLGGESRGEVLDFSATWCGPCQHMSPIVSRLEREGLPIRKVDVDQERALTQKYNVQSIPAFLLIVDGQEVTRIVGQTSEAELRRLIAKIPVAKPRDTTILADNDADRGASRATVSPPVGEVHQPQPEDKPRSLLPDLIANRDQEPETARGNNEDAPLGGSIPVNDPMSASVRIRVTIAGRINLGSGTVVDSRSGRTLIVTCGHIFRDMDEATKVEVDLFANGAHRTYVGTVYGYDFEADVGLISVPTDSAVASVPMASAQLGLKQGDRVACIGCSGGNDPSREQLTVTAINKYDGPDNIECTGTPVQGRSGGGLFNSDGALVGVCIAADQRADRGLYAHAFAIHRLLDECKLTYLYQAPESPLAADSSFVADAAETAPAELPEESPFADYQNPAPPTSQVSVEEEAIAGAVADVAAGDAEVVVIIRPRNQPNVPSRVVVINQPSSKFYSYLNGELHPSQPTQSLTARRLQATTQTVPVPREETAAPSTVDRDERATERKESLRPTTLSRDAGPQRYVRSVR